MQYAVVQKHPNNAAMLSHNASETHGFAVTNS